MNPVLIESDFFASLNDAKTWCDQRLRGTSDYSRLRTSELAASHRGIPEPYGQSYASINALVDTRSRLLNTQIASNHTSERLLCCDVAASEAPGASSLASNGYINEFDLPPWDTWVAWMGYHKPAQKDNGFILAFVPPSCKNMVQSGIDANPVECLFWLDAAHRYYRKRFRRVMPKWLAEYAQANAPIQNLS